MFMMALMSTIYTFKEIIKTMITKIMKATTTTTMTIMIIMVNSFKTLNWSENNKSYHLTDLNIFSLFNNSVYTVVRAAPVTVWRRRNSSLRSTV